MNQFEVTINGTTLQLTAEDVAVLSTAMMDAMRTPSEQTFRKGTTGNIYAKLMNGQSGSAQRFSKQSSTGIVETDC
ncbi:MULTISPECIES: hypothetical protein [Halomonadaceae]|uniref:hypothetical protein n=1 Tax=Halomonadaceae TaxID=28256 RepID=UPI0012F087EF|nr:MULTISPECIES: hypothetical protein [Halomonas]CAD5264565.1 conserved hypothetical protein [Halomonas sp. 156]CAD5265730.1 conserved hypothetical protein [Halomonas sp. I3]CAD5284069.1 conserved hypothetical protein [Halomonas sp. 113]CAD5285535.1 conserved hypothetical protein [Halomonas sp. 59]VXB27082.1 conserved hypothetical protein [Halomonas titanicae]